MESWLRLANLPIGPKLAGALLDRFGDADAVFDASADDLCDVPGFTPKHLQHLRASAYLPSREQVEWLDFSGTRVIPRTSPAFPESLRDIPDPPVLLFVQGELSERDRFSVAVVGTRHPTPYGRGVTAALARDLATAGLTIVSGGALGIDTAAHEAAVDAGGRTIVVLGCGVDVAYPRENLPLFERIVAEGRGAIVSEYAIGAQPERWRFPLRNRLISGLSMGLIVTEAGAQSGALITAGLAGDQGKDVMAVPGNVDRLESRGTNGLIRDGAVLVETAQDVLRALNVLTLEPPRDESRPAPVAVCSANLPEAQQRLIGALTLTPKHIDALAVDVRMSASDASVNLTLLELAGLVRRLPGNCYVRAL